MSRTSAIARIKEAALSLVVERGVGPTTIRDLAHAAGVSEGALYRHYATKEDLIRELFRERYGAFAHRLELVQAKEKGLRAKLRAIVRDTCRLFDEDQISYRFLLLAQHEAMRLFPPGPESPVPVLRGMIAAAIRTGEIKFRNADLGAALILGLMIQPAVSVVNGTLSGPLSRHADEMAGACERTLFK
ncbi:MAG: TetR/AcrR family transcriptional regulator [Alphaproteobacteria bacterium]|nr:TetR/AcrR family transcriptional regulator [Alphaproteobacteria bacterium]MBV9692396.1 TetR/AcrR family transcriptional regulator [Alphaproteobacteria bacterium]